ncbi:response regulator [uncultured Cohaesibacter sp.]|uniref:response regulator transcription factor n=1 Tax=uncultured Cohaesibacter sp. TaxID=1002546 RepID=UPI002AA73973|nr:response regulator [uncultured Cohaesibacter sp.]
MYDVAIVEDEELERRALRTILSNKVDGINIVGEARNGVEAMDLINNNAIDLILVDINIPKPNGLEIIQSLRQKNMKTKVVILTAYDYFEIMQKAIHLKADSFLLKPVKTEELLRVVNECLGDLGASRTHNEIADQIWTLLEQRSYRECLSLVRKHLEGIYASKDKVPRQAILEFSDELFALSEKRKVAMPDDILEQIVNLRKERLDARSRNRIHGLFCQIVDALFQVTEEHFGRSPERMQNVLNYIERNLNKEITLEDAANCASVSPCYFSRLFKKSMGETFVAYVKHRRINHAKDLLEGSDLPIMNIALDLSFNDINYFAKVFKKEVGVTPSEFRRQCRS